MTEAELLAVISTAVSGIVADPSVDSTTPIAGVTNMQQKVFITNLTNTPHTADIFTVYYYVEDKGEAGEAAYLSEIRNHSTITATINASLVTTTTEEPTTTTPAP